MARETGRIRGTMDALAQRLRQPVETVTRSSRLFIESGGVDDINPPEDIDELHDLYREIGIIRGNINQFVRDVVAPGVVYEAEVVDIKGYGFFVRLMNTTGYNDVSGLVHERHLGMQKPHDFDRGDMVTVELEDFDGGPSFLPHETDSASGLDSLFPNRGESDD